MSNSKVAPSHSYGLWLQERFEKAPARYGIAERRGLRHQNVYFSDSSMLRGMPGWPVRMPNEASWLNMLR
jgi:hypothetical protein